MPSPAERYAAARRPGFGSPELTRFAAALDFEVDGFQVEACEALESGRGVLVAAPTGSGKTVVGEFAVHLALARGQKAFYTTPIKALSNQKYRDLLARHGAGNVGLLTGDTSIDGEAPIVVMTTEVLRNMIYAGSSTLDGLAFVVMDEVHYLADRFRGPVWEEVLIQLPDRVQVVSLSATVSNAEEFGAWLDQVRGDTAIVLSEHRPVPLWQHMQVGRRMYDLFADETPDTRPTPGRVDPRLLEAIRDVERSGPPRGERGSGREFGRRGPRGGRRDVDHRARGEEPRGPRQPVRASRVEVIRQLEEAELLPAITFIFSRAGCDAAVEQMLASGLRLVPEADGSRIRWYVEERVASIDSEDLGVLGYHDFVEGLARGFAAHHAGMLPVFREIVEELFVEGRVRAVFATETLALGINMPARSVVIEKLVKWNGEAHVPLSPAEYTQLTGRAGRRGIDVEGHAIVVWQRGVDPVEVAGLASTRTYPLRSSFRPTYNMAVNLVAQVGRSVAREILETSFAQFQADRSVVSIATQVRRNDEALEGYAEAMHCDRGDFREYAALRHQVSEAEKSGKRRRNAQRRAETAVSLEELRVGDVVHVGGGRRPGWVVVVHPARPRPGQDAAPGVVTEDKQYRRLFAGDLDGPVAPATRIDVPRGFNPKSPRARRDLATSLRTSTPHEPPPRASAAATGPDDRDHVERLRQRLREHPCHDCPDREEHARWSERWWKLKRENVGLQRKVDSRTGSVAARFDRICAVLVELGYLADDGESVTDAGQRLRRIYSEKDLLVAECIRTDLWRRLDPAELAAVVSTLVHEPRGEPSDLSPRLPTAAVDEAWEEMSRLWETIVAREAERDLESPAAPDAGIAWSMHRWTSGRGLEEVLRDQELAAGDFVRRAKQVVDLLGQLANASEDPLRRNARSAAAAIMRGVVATDRLD